MHTSAAAFLAMSESDESHVNQDVDAARDPPKQFRFKDHDNQRDKTRDDHDSTDSTRRRHRHHHSSHHRSKRRRTETDSAAHPLPRNGATQGLDPDRAFQESLFDALGDDEGADFWQGVYGQPIHTYPNTYRDEETGELEQMNDEDYAQYVRRRMWEKSREGVEAAKEEKRQEKLREKERQEKDEERRTLPPKEAHNNFVFDFEIEASLRRGKRRKDKKRWQDLWADYVNKSEELRSLAENHDHVQEPENLFLRNRIAWPVESGKRKDLNTEEIERFVTRGINAVESDKSRSDSALLAALKQERVRWHPDKMQQRYGFMQIDDLTMQGITATFQVFDRMWNELKASSRH